MVRTSRTSRRFSLEDEATPIRRCIVPGLVSYVTRDIAEACLCVSRNASFDLFADGLGTYLCAERAGVVASQMPTFWPIASSVELSGLLDQVGSISGVVGHLLPCVEGLILAAQRCRASRSEQLDLFAL